VSEDGKLRLISNWDSLSEAERAVAWRRITERNRVRGAASARSFSGGPLAHGRRA
jgi:predicted Fe-S protein YdhL (DUF1289 family)